MSTPLYRSPRLLGGLALAVLLISLLYLYGGTLQDLWAPFAKLNADPTQPLTLTPAFWQALFSLAFAGMTSLVTGSLFFALISQFVLPVTPAQREQALAHFLQHSLGRPSPAIFVENGKLVASAAEKAHRSLASGVILVDSVSGIVLQTDTHFTRAHGPGVVFTRLGEYPTEQNVLDLRQQTRTPPQVLALTRDGIEVRVDITVNFALHSGEPQPFREWADPNQAPFAFDAVHAPAAVYGSPVRGQAPPDWRDLPVLLAADMWRELLIQRDLESLFNPTNDGTNVLETLQTHLYHRLTGERGAWRSNEYRVLADRRVRVLSITLSNLGLPAEVREKRLSNWKEDWRKRASEFATEKDPDLKRLRTEGERQARTKAVEDLTVFVREQLVQKRRPTTSEVTLRLAEATHQLALEVPVRAQLSSDTMQALTRMVGWARNLHNGQGPGEGE